MNSRPLTYLSSHQEDLKPITPNDFLLPKAARDLPPVQKEDANNWNLKLRMVDEALTNAWDRFVAEYLPSLHKTSKWNKQEDNFVIGDIVMSLEKGPRHRGRYPLAKVIQVQEDADGVVRNVKVQIRNEKPVKRHVQSLVRLFSFDGPRITACDSKEKEKKTSPEDDEEDYDESILGDEPDQPEEEEQNLFLQTAQCMLASLPAYLPPELKELPTGSTGQGERCVTWEEEPTGNAEQQ